MSEQPAESDGEVEHPEWEVAIRAYGPDDEPGESRWKHYHPRAPDKETAREKAIEEAKSPGINSIIGISDCYDVIEVTGPYDPEIVTDGGREVGSADTVSQDGDEDRSIMDIAREYLRAVDEHEAKKEELLSQWAEEYYRPGYLDDREWERLKDLMDADETDHALTQIEIACYRKAATELGRADEFDDEWPAKDGVSR